MPKEREREREGGKAKDERKAGGGTQHLLGERGELAGGKLVHALDGSVSREDVAGSARALVLDRGDCSRAPPVVARRHLALDQLTLRLGLSSRHSCALQLQPPSGARNLNREPSVGASDLVFGHVAHLVDAQREGGVGVGVEVLDEGEVVAPHVVPVPELRTRIAASVVPGD